MKLGRLAISRNLYRALGPPILGGLVACSGGPTGSEPNLPGSDTNPPAIEAAAPLSIQGVLHGTDAGPIGDVTVCLRPDPLVAGKGPCTTSDSGGAWRIASMPANAFVAITFEKADFVPLLRAIATDTSDVTLAADEDVLETSETFAARTGRSFDASTGSIAFFASIPGSPQAVAATASLRPLDGPPRAPPHYDDALADGGSGKSGVFTSIPDGFYVLTLGDASVRCAVGGSLYGYPTSLYAPPDEARLLVPAVAGFLTTPIAAVCTAAPSTP